MQRRRRWIIGGSVAGLLTVVCAIIPMPAASLGEEISRIAEVRLGIRLEISSSTLSLTRGVTLRDVSARASTPRLDLSARIDRIVATHALSLRRPLRVEAIRMIRPVMTLTVGDGLSDPRVAAVPSPATEPGRADPGHATEADTLGRTSFAFGDVDGIEVRLTLADLEVRSPGTNAIPLRAVGTDIALQGVSHDASSSLLTGLGGRGTMTSRQLWIGPVVAVDATSRLTIDAGHIRLSDLTFWCDGRNLLLREVEIDLTKAPLSIVPPGTISERRRPDPNAAAEWVPIGSLAELYELCRGSL